MVEPLLYAALGFLTASLVALFLSRALWNRAVRLTTHRIMRRLPLSRDEIVASRDLVRAEQAIEHRRLERQANIMRSRMTASMADVGRRDALIIEMRATAEADRAKVAEAEAQHAAALKEVEKVKAEHAATRGKLAQTERVLADTQRAVKELERERAELMHLADDRRVETVGAQTQTTHARQTIASLEKQIAAAHKSAEATQERLNRTNEAVKQETARAELLHAKLVATESQLSQALTKLELDTREHRAELDSLRAQKNALENELTLARIEKQGAERQVSTEGEEVALLRQQIERLAGDIARAVGNGASPADGSERPRRPAARVTRDAEPADVPPHRG